MPDLPFLPEHQQMAEELVAAAHRHDGLAPLDVERFWADNEQACADPFGDIPQLPLGIRMNWECVFDELGLEENHRAHLDNESLALERHRTYNDRAERICGRRFLNENPRDNSRQYPPVKQLHDLFEARNVWHGNSWWLEQSAGTADELAALLDRVDARLEDLRAFMLPANWEDEKARVSALGVKPGLYRHQRGPVTFAASVFGPENLIFLIIDNPDLALRFRDAILRGMLGIGRVLDEEAGYTPESAPRGFSFADDNCCLLSPDMYELFGYPILKAVFERYAPGPQDGRFQHSDSNMAHLLPLLGKLNLTGANFGPTLTVTEIRAHLPRAVIQGQLAPFTFSRNEEIRIVLETLRDFEMSRAHKGVWFTTAGSINNGSRLTGLRLIMAAIQRWCRY